MSQLYETTKTAYRVRGPPKPSLELRGQTNPTWSVAFLPNGKKVISASADGNIQRWRVKDGCELGREMRENGVVYAVAASGDGLWIATGGKARNITIWDATTHEKVTELDGHSDTTRSLEFSRDSARLVSGSTDLKTVIVWNTVTGQKLLGPLKGHTRSVWEAHFSPNGDKIASCDGGDIRIWNSHSGDPVIQPITVWAVSLAWTPNGQQLIAGCGQGFVKRFASSTDSLLADWKAHTKLVHSIAISPNGNFLVSASPDKTIRFWDMMTSTQIGSPLQCPDRVYSVAISPNGTHLARGRRDSQVHIWRLKRVVPPSFLKDMPAKPNVWARLHGLLSNRSAVNKKRFRPLCESAHGYVINSLSYMEEPTELRQGKDPGHLGLLTNDRDVSSDSNMVAISTYHEELPQSTPWNLDKIFPDDLTGSVTREGEHPFASGSYGDIYKGTLSVWGRSIDVAVKAIRTYSANDGNDAGKKRRLNREIRVWLNLKHINVLPLFGTTMDFGQFPAMVCPWLEDGPLTSYLERRNDSLTTVERLVLVADVAVGLQYLHSQTVVHGDLSGSNVLIQGSGRACISDFGMSTLLTELEGSILPTSLHVGGALRWAAPELLDLQVPDNGDNPHKVVPTPQSDVYSFGGIMLQALTGKVPYHYYSREAQVLHAISRGEIPKRPNQALVTDRRWTFIQQCWTLLDDDDAGQSRPSDDAIVEFTRNDLVQSVIP
ncbi:WD40 repeat-like protein [Paxillus ammoniavirescens]|nr:WD40 repeat-like protein [Paxillus ammoniavirescens]